MGETIKKEKEVLTLKKLKDSQPDSIIASGKVINSHEGVYITNNRLGHTMKWFAVRGVIHDWCIYIHWASNTDEFVLSSGDKVSNRDTIKKLVPCDNEALKMYRF